MSWRFLIAILIAAAGAAAWGGIQLGDWMVAHAPQANANATVNQDDNWSQQPVLDANGHPYTAQPPQPRVDGTLGVPDHPPQQDWAVQRASLFDSTVDPSVQLSRGNATDDQAAAVAAGNNSLRGTSDVATLDLDAAINRNPPPAPASQQPITASPGLGHAPLVAQARAPAAQSHPAASTAPSWQESLRREVAQCSSLGFFERPTCVWAARNKYCEPNRGWGSIPECPARTGPGN